MPSKLENLNETKDGARFVMEGDCLGSHITVVTAFDGNYDDWPYHVYLQNGERPRQRLTTRPHYTQRKHQTQRLRARSAAGHQLAHASPPIDKHNYNEKSASST